MNEENQKGNKPIEPVIIRKKPVSKKLKEKGARIVIGTLNIFAAPIRAKAGRPSVETGKKRRIFDLAILLVVLSLGALIFFLWFIFKPRPVPVEMSINIAPEIVKSGEKITYTIDYFNEGKGKLSDSHLAIKFPSNFILDQAFPATFNRTNNTFSIGDLEQGASGEVKITGFIFGRVGESKKITAIFSCLDKNGKRKQKATSKIFNLEGSLLSGGMELPDKIFNNSPFDLIIIYKNSSKAEIEEAFVELNFAQGFIVKESNYRIEADNSIDISDFKPGEKKEIRIRGFVSRIRQDEPVEVNFISKFGVVLEGQRITQSEISKTVELNFPNFSFNQITEPLNAFPGEYLTYKINYQNKEKVNIENLEIEIKLDEKFLDVSSIEAETTARIEKDKVIWENLGVLEPQETGELKFKVKVIKHIPVKKPGEENNFVITIQPKANYKLSTDLTREVVAIGRPLDVKINSDLTLEAKARYFTPEGDQLGIGPLPPVVGEETRYWIILRVGNSTNRVKETRLVASLPPNVRYTGKTSVSYGEALDYNSDRQEVSWFIGDVPEYLGRTQPAYEAGFEVGVTPTENDIGKPMTLVNSVKLVGVDEFTNDELESSVGRLTTELEGDRFAKGMGVVEAW